MSDMVFELKDVHFSYLGRFPALSGIDVNIKAGEKVAIIGANGSGKSTLLHMLDGLVFPDKGTFKFSGKEFRETDLSNEEFSVNFRKKVGLVFQNPEVQLFCPTVKEDIVFGPLQLGAGKKEIKERMEEVLAILGIEHLLDRSPHQLSVGEKHKVAIASTLMIDPDILILDEPAAGLDPTTTRHIIDLLIHANEAGKTVITSTHDLHIVEELSDTVHVFGQDKRIVASGAPAQILNDTVLLDDNNLVHVHSHTHEGKTHTHPHLHI